MNHALAHLLFLPFFFFFFLPVSNIVRQETLGLERAEIHSFGDLCYGQRLEPLKLPVSFIISRLLWGARKGVSMESRLHL